MQQQQQANVKIMSHLSLSPPSQAGGGLNSPSIAVSSCTSAGGGGDGFNLGGGGGGGGGGGPSCSEVMGLMKLGSDIEGLFLKPHDYSDAVINIMEGVSVPVHRCILAARCPVFRRFFEQISTPASSSSSEDEDDVMLKKETKRKRKKRKKNKKSGTVELELKEIVKGGKMGKQTLMVVLDYVYGGRLKKVDEINRVACMDPSCSHFDCWPVIEFCLELLFAGFLFEISELKVMSEQHLLKLVGKAQAENVLQMLAVANANGAMDLQQECITVLCKSNVPSMMVEKTLAPQLAKEILASRLHMIDHTEEKLCRRVYKALDSDDIELMGLLLKEAKLTVDSVYALHYASAYCDVKILAELLELGVGDINLKDPYGYNVLHIATMRRDPKVIGLILEKGALPHGINPDGYTALKMSKRLARNTELLEPGEARDDWLQDKICVEILEQAEHVNPCPVFPAVENERQLFMRLLYLENRVALARLLFPREVEVVLELSQVDATKEFTCLKRETNMDLNKEPSSSIVMNDTIVQRVEALQRAIEVGHRFFPRCTAILNEYMDDGSFEHACIQNRHIPQDTLKKRKRDSDLKNKFAEAFQKDVEDQISKSQTLSQC